MIDVLQGCWPAVIDMREVCLPATGSNAIPLVSLTGRGGTTCIGQGPERCQIGACLTAAAGPTSSVIGLLAICPHVCAALRW